MPDGALELALEQPRGFGREPRDEDVLLALNELARDGDNLLRRLACAEDDFRKALAQRAVRIHLREAEVRDGRGLEGAENFVPAGTASAEGIKKGGGLFGSHGREDAVAAGENEV